jgi:hypothetical protein
LAIRWRLILAGPSSHHLLSCTPYWHYLIIIWLGSDLAAEVAFSAPARLAKPRLFAAPLVTRMQGVASQTSIEQRGRQSMM